MDTADVIVAGGGIVGLSAAVELSRSGLRVRVLEKGRVMSEASWAAAGMLAVHDGDHPAALRNLAAYSNELYPDYLRVVGELSGKPVRLRTRAALLTEPAPTAVALDAREAARRVPGLATEGRRFWWMEEASLDPRDLCAALPLAARAAGVDIQQDTVVLSVASHGASVVVTTGRETLSAGAFINCCGAWAGNVGFPAAAATPALRVEPRKGQMLKARLPQAIDLAYVIRTAEIYLVPRGDGQVVIGATVEQAGFDRSLDPEALGRLHSLAAEVWPPIGLAAMSDSWAGFRPGTPDALPMIGSAGEKRCWVATGHFRNGILLAPATAVLLRELVQGVPPAIDVAAFSPGRAAPGLNGAAW